MNYEPTVLSFLDYLDEKEVWRSGIDDRPTHQDSYMTVMDVALFDQAMKTLPAVFTKEVLVEVIGYEKVQGLPMSNLLARKLERFLGLPLS
mgnify:CR=1 FL=1